jgi:hypothetical protein
VSRIVIVCAMLEQNAAEFLVRLVRRLHAFDSGPCSAVSSAYADVSSLIVTATTVFVFSGDCLFATVIC